MDINDLRSMFTVLTFVLFVGIVWWAYSGQRKQAFDEAANLPLDDDSVPGGTGAGSTDK
ncbi:cbb3-type cytochrome oxidase subunit 3 [Denitratisoma oestradiolicum]|uniref:CcoQ/FixQ family Cbb3-type cytochrome c oxidase assembly chaperone n=1 Tax=Denitratisoma oestradiolicum TaxID=311182 RepID=A0A6S6XZP2_9PROT|nr:cbb3-type cytochrome c oxidase subunit 3 [Denitratisoma oestradiolicum]TWO79906.1 CcoQ/FixQ family Cbb3-type cytochrome c oxidase assembly chaperone [Denitratisoma oestradiolicum]CAB1369661.1 protein of unknown function [Denitratisoma oestradiolicum]